MKALSDNSDFNKFITDVCKDFSYGEAHEDKYDKELSEEELSEQYHKFFSNKN